MTMVIQLKGTSFNNSNLPKFVRKVNGFVQEGLQNLYMFEDDSPASLIADELSNDNTSINTTGSSGGFDKLSGGGINIRGTATMEAGSINVREPFTVLLAGAMLIPVDNSSSGYNQALMGFAEYATRGLLVYAQQGAALPTSADRIPAFVRGTNAGGQDAAATWQLDNLATNEWTYGDNSVFVLSHDGAGNFSFDIYRQGSPIAVKKQFALDLDAITTVGGVANNDLRPCIGTLYPAFISGNVNADVMAVYTRALSASELQTALAACADIGNARGRTY